MLFPDTKKVARRFRDLKSFISLTLSIFMILQKNKTDDGYAIGRRRDTGELKQLYDSGKPEFVAIGGSYFILSG